MASNSAIDQNLVASFDPIGSLLIDVALEPGETRTVKLLIGCVEDDSQIESLVARHVQPQPKELPSDESPKERAPRIGHGDERRRPLRGVWSGSSNIGCPYGLSNRNYRDFR